MSSHPDGREVIELARSLRNRVEQHRDSSRAAEDLALQQCDPKFLRSLMHAEPRAHAARSPWWIVMLAGVAFSALATVLATH